MIRDFPVPPGVRASTSPDPAVTPDRTEPAGSPGGDPVDVPVRDAATVMLVRDRPAGVEVFVFRRVASMAFAAGMHVFPGGRTDPTDADPRVPWEGPGAGWLAAALSAPPDLARALAVAAVRETFEECGVLLAAPPGGGPVVGLPTGRAGARESMRQALLDGTAGLADVLLDAGLVLRADTLRPWARWVTPPGERRRYDTRFFVAAMPPEQEALDLGGEGERAEWIGAAEAVRRYRSGRARMMPPTIVTLEEIAAAPDVATLCTTRRVIAPVMPWFVRSDDGAATVRVALDGRGGGRAGP